MQELQSNYEIILINKKLDKVKVYEGGNCISCD